MPSAQLLIGYALYCSRSLLLRGCGKGALPLQTARSAPVDPRMDLVPYELGSIVPPLKGLVFALATHPALPRWANYFYFVLRAFLTVTLP